MLLRVRGRAAHDLLEVTERADCLGVERDASERRFERVGLRQREAATRNVVRGAEQYYAAHQPARGGELVVGARRDRARIDVAGVRHDERLGIAEARLEIIDAVEELGELVSELARVAGIEGPRDCRGSDRGCLRYQSHLSSPCNAWITDRRRTAARPPPKRLVSLRSLRPCAHAKQTVPTGLPGVPPPGPAMPVIATAVVLRPRSAARVRRRAPSAMARAVCSLTAPNRRRVFAPTPRSCRLATFEYVT